MALKHSKVDYTQVVFSFNQQVEHKKLSDPSINTSEVDAGISPSALLHSNYWDSSDTQISACSHWLQMLENIYFPAKPFNRNRSLDSVTDFQYMCTILMKQFNEE